MGRAGSKPVVSGKPFKGVDPDSQYTVREIFGYISGALDLVEIPVLQLDLGSHVNDQREDKTESITDEDNEHLDDVENLFVRLNSAGTPLTGEELNYSLLKSAIAKPDQQRIENACYGMMRPARLVTISYRLYQQHRKELKGPGSMRIKPKEFQARMRSDTDVDGFVDFVNEKLLPGLQQVKSLLTYCPQVNELGFPKPMISHICERAPELIYLMLHRLINRGDQIELNTTIQKRVLGFISLTAWFGKWGKFRNHEPLLRNIWPADSLSSQDFWSSLLVDRAKLVRNDQQALMDIPTFKIAKREFNRLITSNTSYKSKGRYSDIDENLRNFVEKASKEKMLLLYAQRAALADWFDDFEFDLEDTNRPFDWDHISAHAMLYRRHGIPAPLSNWYGSIGNLRAWPYSENRKDQDLPPATKMKGPSHLRDSCCSPEWLQHNFTNLKDKNSQKMVYKLILKRNSELIRTWFDTLEIGELIESQSVRIRHEFEKLFDLRKTTSERSDGSVLFPFQITDHLEAYIMFDDPSYSGALCQDGVEFGVWCRDGLNKKEFRKIVGGDVVIESDGDAGFMTRSRTTLLEHTHDCYTRIVSGLMEWLSQFESQFATEAKKSVLNHLRATTAKAVS